MKHCHMANGHPRRKIPKFPDGGGQAFPDGGAKAPLCPPVAPRLCAKTVNDKVVSHYSLAYLSVQK